MAIYQKMGLIDGTDHFAAENVDHMEDGILYACNSVDDNIKKNMLVSEGHYGIKNIFDYHPLLETDDHGEAGTYDPENNVVSCSLVHIARLFGSNPYPIYFEANAYYNFSFQIKYTGEVTEGQGLKLSLEYEDGYTYDRWYNNNISEYESVSFYSTLDHGKLMNMYLSYNTAGNTVYLKNFQVEKGLSQTAYENPKYVRTAIDSIARHRAGDWVLLGEFEEDTSEQIWEIPFDKTYRKMLIIFNMAAATQTSNALLRFTDADNHNIDVYSNVTTSGKKGTLSLDLDRIEFPERHAFADTNTSQTTISTYPGVVNLEFSGIESFQYKVYSGDNVVPVGSKIKIYVSRWE